MGDAAVEAAARALACLEPGEDWADHDGMFAEGDEYRRNMRDQAAPAIAAALPHLLAPIRELHTPRGMWYRGEWRRSCWGCGLVYPCSTILICDELEGKTDEETQDQG
ncbi:hypothetical protein ACQCX2_07675 [Propionibacteriaceae bacterium Y1700]|uniref:hypothetical protein n=1 Tax=Microlunatus sp. Y1700 TaxID=3418487 RepID=UPI003DA7783D